MLVLVFLVVLTLLGTTALRTARIEEQLAGTTYDRLVARSATDAAIADGVDFVWKDAGPTSVNSNLYDATVARDGWTVLSWRQNNTVWTAGGANKALAFGSGGFATSDTLGLWPATPSLAHPVKANPTFIVDRMPQLFIDPQMQVWRVTARGVGSRASTESYGEVMLTIRGN